MIELFPTPEAAAMQGFPAAYCRVLAVDVDGDDGFVMLDTGPAEYRYLYGGTVKRMAGGWCGGADSNGGGVGWTLTDWDHHIGVVHLCDEAPPGADVVRVSWRGEEREVPVRNGVYLVTWWREPNSEGDMPRVTEFRVGSRWIEVTEKLMPKRSITSLDPTRFAAKLNEWINGLPEFWQPIAGGASIIVVFMAARGAVFLFPLAVIYVLLTSSTPLTDLTNLAAVLVIAVFAGALSGLMFSLVGRRLRRLGLVGYYLSAIVTVAPYLFILVNLGLDRRTPGLFHRADGWDYGFAAIGSIVAGVMFGHAFYKRDQRKASVAEPVT